MREKPLPFPQIIRCYRECKNHFTGKTGSRRYQRYLAWCLAVSTLLWANLALTAPPIAPQNLVGSFNETELTVNLSWDSPPTEQGVVGYNVYRNNNYISTVSTNNFSESITVGDTHTYYVTSFDSTPEFSIASPSITLPGGGEPVIDDEAPTAPTNLIGNLSEIDGQFTANLAWDSSTDNVQIKSYNVHINNLYFTTVNSTSISVPVSDAFNSFFVVAIDTSDNYSNQSNLLTLPNSDNLAPYFEGLADVTAYAGETIEILVKPVDIDSNTPPGVSFEQLPIGMSMTDNLDGTRTLRWSVLQPQIGQYDITVTATDAEDVTLSFSQTITITVELPDDESTIPNLKPAINLIEPHIVRTGDTVIMHVRGTDPNGTIPALSLINPPVGSTFLPRGPDFPDVTVLTWPTTASDLGTTELIFLASDQIDSSLISTQTVTLEVADPAQFIRQGSRLSDLADQNGLLFGFASTLLISEKPDADLYRNIAAEEFNFVTAENGMKWSYLNPEPGFFRWDSADELLQYATSNNLLVHGHTLVWYSALPQWIYQSDISDREGLMNDFIDTVLTRYSDVAVWDVVNEAFEDDGSYRNSVWFEAMGKNHIAKAFQRARLNDPDSTLIYNDYDISTAGPKFDAVYLMASELVGQGVPIDGIGFQMHINSEFEAFDEIAENFARIAALGLDIFITELDVSMLIGSDETEQANVFANVVAVCLAQPACKAVQTWGLTDRYSWLRDFNPLLFDRNYQAKPAYYAIQDLLAGNTLPEDGSCGTNHLQTLANAPTTQLCAAGTATSVLGEGPWNWSCEGIGPGAANAQCRADLDDSNNSTDDQLRVSALAQIITGFELFALDNATYNTGNGYRDRGIGWFHNNTSSTYQDGAIAEALTSGGYLVDPAPADPRHPVIGQLNNFDFMVYHCADRVGVFSKSDGVVPSTADSQWWNSNRCKQAPISNYDHTYFVVSDPLDDIDTNSDNNGATEPPPTVIDGSCGASHQLTLANAPTTQLCAAGTATSVLGQGPWNWSCEGIGPGAANAQCSAERHEEPTVTDGTCGASHLQSLANAPTTQLCAAGTATSVLGQGPWNWSCEGIGSGAANAQCRADLDNSNNTSDDQLRVTALAQIITGFELFALDNATYNTGNGYRDRGIGWFHNNTSSTYQDGAIAEALTSSGYLVDPAPADPRHPVIGQLNNFDFMVYHCADRVGVFSKSDGVLPSTADSQWWNSNRCKQAPISNYDHTYFVVSDPLDDIDTNSDNNGATEPPPTVIDGSCGASHQLTLANAPTTQLCAAGTATSVLGEGPWIWSCEGIGPGAANAQCSAERHEEPTVTDGTCGASHLQSLANAPTTQLCAAGTATSVLGQGPWNWSCEGIGSGAANAQCRADLDNSNNTSDDQLRVTALAQIITGFELFALDNATYNTGNGYRDRGIGWFHNNTSSTYQDGAIAEALTSSGYLVDPAPADPRHPVIGQLNNFDFMVYHCADRVGVFSKSDGVLPSTADSQWWNSNRCKQAPISNHDHTYFVVSDPLDDIDTNSDNNGATEPPPTVIDGSCGASHQLTLANAPTTQLCAAGTATSVLGEGPWNWSCEGIGPGAANTQCNASIVDPVADDDFSLNLSTALINIVEGGNNISLPMSVLRGNGHTANIDFDVMATTASDASNLTATFNQQILDNTQNENTLVLQLSIDVAPIQSETRTLLIRASDGSTTKTRTLTVNVEPIDAPDVYLLIGQSNMRGPSELGAKDAGPNGLDAPDSRIRQINVTENTTRIFSNISDFTDDSKNIATPRFITAEDPLHDTADATNQSKAGTQIGMGLSFAKAALSSTDRDIVLVPAAWGGTGFCGNGRAEGLSWNSGSQDDPILGGTGLFDRALFRTNITLSETGGILRGILWHQGESDSVSIACSNLYASNLTAMVDAFRNRIQPDARGGVARGSNSDVPFILGTMSRGVDERGAFDIYDAPKTEIDLVHRSITVGLDAAIPSAGYVNNDDLVPTAWPCGTLSCIHFGSTAIREIGERYYQKLVEIITQD